jgi:hypothetical protein
MRDEKFWLGLRWGDSFPPPFGGRRFGWRYFIRKFKHHELGGEFLGTMQVEINGGTFGIRLGYHTQSVLAMPDALAFRERLHEKPPL